jgi:hypothetical protein
VSIVPNSSSVTVSRGYRSDSIENAITPLLLYGHNQTTAFVYRAIA